MLNPALAGRGTFRSKLVRSDEPKVNQVQIKFKDQMTKKSEEEWDDGTRVILSNFGHLSLI
jgi:hypothetical protein